MLLEYTKWKKLHESVQPDMTHVTLTYPTNNFASLETAEFYNKVLTNLFAKFEFAKVSNYKFDYGRVSADLSLTSEENSDIFDLIGVSSKFKLSFDQSIYNFTRYFDDFITNTARSFPNVTKVINESNFVARKYVIIFGPGKVDTSELLDFIFSDEEIFKSLNATPDTLLTEQYFEELLDNPGKESELSDRARTSFKAQLISEIRNLMKVSVTEIDLASYKQKNEDLLNDLASRAKSFDSLEESEKLEFISKMLKLQKELSVSYKYMMAKDRSTAQYLIRSYEILDMANISEKDIDHFVSLLKKEN